MSFHFLWDEGDLFLTHLRYVFLTLPHVCCTFDEIDEIVIKYRFNLWSKWFARMRVLSSNLSIYFMKCDWYLIF